VIGRDFREARQGLRRSPGEGDAHADEWFRELYATWRRAFELASDDGAVAFH